MSQCSLNQWDAVSSNYSEKVLTPFSNQHSTETFLSSISSDDVSGSILDAGCGNGYFLQSLLNKFTLAQTPVALDSSYKMVERTAQKLGNTVHLVHSSIDSIPFKNCSFDHIFVINSVISSERSVRENCLTELHRTLCSGRKITLLLPALESYWEQLHVAREQFITEGMDEQQAIWEVYHSTNERLFDPIGGYINITNSSLRIKLYTTWEIEHLLGSFGFIDITVCKYSYSQEHCKQIGLYCDKDGLFDWFVTARKRDYSK